MERIGHVSLWPLISRSAKPVPSGVWNNSAVCASSIRMSACVGSRPPVPPVSPAMARSSSVTRQPAFFSCVRSVSNAARSSFFSAASRSSISGANGAPGSMAVLSTSPSSGSTFVFAACLGRHVGDSEASRLDWSAGDTSIVLLARRSRRWRSRPPSDMASLALAQQVVEVASAIRRGDLDGSAFGPPSQPRIACRVVGPHRSGSAAITTRRASGGSTRPLAMLPALIGRPCRKAHQAARRGGVSMPSPMTSGASAESGCSRIAPPQIGAEARLGRFDARLRSVAGEEGAMHRHRLAGRVLHQRDQGRKPPAFRVRRVAAKSERRRRGKPWQDRARSGSDPPACRWQVQIRARAQRRFLFPLADCGRVAIVALLAVGVPARLPGPPPPPMLRSWQRRTTAWRTPVSTRPDSRRCRVVAAGNVRAMIADTASSRDGGNVGGIHLAGLPRRRGLEPDTRSCELQLPPAYPDTICRPVPSAGAVALQGALGAWICAAGRLARYARTVPKSTRVALPTLTNLTNPSPARRYRRLRERP